MAGQIFTDGDVQTIGGQVFECVAVSYAETDGEKYNFTYSFRLKSELDAEREAVKALTETDDSAEAIAEAPAPGEVTKEETQHVK